MPLPAPTGNNIKSQKVAIIAGSVAGAVVVIAVVFSLVCYFVFRRKGGGGPRADHSHRKTVTAVSRWLEVLNDLFSSVRLRTWILRAEERVLAPGKYSNKLPSPQPSSP